ncbi:hypothetical protein KVP09_14595 [Alcaligenaceae bacterium CGII-47]|nr:hypothetical protein [Alcaligenaceae bacterium CGII-47]
MQARIRTGDVNQFPDLPRFIDMHRKNQLLSPTAAAVRILDYLSRKDFGTTVIDDIRNYA